MKVLVDTPIWSYALRSNRKGFEKHVSTLKRLISDQRVLIMGPIRQEVLSGYSDMRQFQKLKEKLSYFENTPIAEADYIEAAKFSNLCRQKGIQGSHTDFLICAVSIRLEAEILTSDQDFSFYQQHIPIKQHEL
ncbi:hypothetical protein MNBD_NITROSPIRAE01-74 [hydrothermal vent metagenome]|uniref:PIN domain-containing protein n=1 Tax=hydrothermal vent metagenome TaxID=652676 RepID=A0A3B1CZD3_9ZZZZ